MLFDEYDPGDFYDELFLAPGLAREFAAELILAIQERSTAQLLQIQQDAETALRQMGITFTVYGDDQGTERVMPFDLIPRIIEAREWDRIERGLKQRIEALNLFLGDIYGEQRILREGIIPAEMVLDSKTYRPECHGLRPPRGIWCHVTGTDLVRDRDGQVYVLEDNLRCPSGVSYMLENRRIQKQCFSSIFQGQHVRTVADYPDHLLAMLQYLAPPEVENPTIAVLTPGIYNSAYFEHSFLASQMGVMLVEGRDLVADGDYAYMRTTEGFRRIDVLYRRIDDDFIDPETFRPDSMLGVPGLMNVYRKGHIALANAPGTGIADDKAIYAYVPEIIKYYLGEEILLPNVPTLVCARPHECEQTLRALDRMVVKAVNESGGYGMLVGPHATEEQRDAFAEKVRNNPRNYIAQPTLSLSRVPTLIEGAVEGRHVDLRPYILYGREIYVQPGGLTRVALRKGSLVVNSSQGGGSKDTWVLHG
jgi:uncharacterized circularly permuted ATP-grasp superfamily protein